MRAFAATTQAAALQAKGSAGSIIVDYPALPRSPHASEGNAEFQRVTLIVTHKHSPDQWLGAGVTQVTG